MSIKDSERMAVITMTRMYYEFNPQTGEIYKSGLMDISFEVILATAQLVVDFEGNHASIIYKTSNFSYEGGLYSTETFEKELDYGAAWKYMKADLQCEKLYYYEDFAGEHLVRILQDS